MNTAARLARGCCLALLLAVFAGCQTFRTTEYLTSRQLFPPESEAALGAEYAAQIEQEYPVASDPVVDPWLQAMGESLARHSPETEQAFTFQLTASPEVNAFAIPGGYCYINVGLVLFAENEAQVAAVVGHEINHVTRRHGLINLQRVMGVQALSVLAAATLEDERVRAASVLATQAGGYLALRSFSRADEREADKLGVEAMYKAGYDPREAARFFERLAELQGRQPSFLENFLSTHPATTERVTAIQEQIQSYDLYSVPLIKSTPEFEAIQERLRQLYGQAYIRQPANGTACSCCSGGGEIVQVGWR